MAITAQTKVVALFGYPVANSLSPIMHNAAFAALGLDYCYVACPVRPEALGDALRAVKALGLRGCNITVPHKEKAVLAGPERSAVPEGSRAMVAEHGRSVPKLLGGCAIVLRDRYLLLIAFLVVLLNWINTTGEFILADFGQRDAARQAAASGGALDPGVLIAAFYGSYQFWVSVVGLAIQLFRWRGCYRSVGVRGALLIHPAVVAVGYGLLADCRRCSSGSCPSSRWCAW